MCSVSAVSNYYQNEFLNNRIGFANPYQGGGLAAQGLQSASTFDAETKEMMRKALILLDKIDKRLGDVECMDDAKAAFLKTLNLDPADISGG